MFEVDVKNVTKKGRREGGPARDWGCDGSNVCILCKERGYICKLALFIKYYLKKII